MYGFAICLLNDFYAVVNILTFDVFIMVCIKRGLIRASDFATLKRYNFVCG